MSELTNIENAINQLKVEIDTLKAKKAISDTALDHLRAIYQTSWIEAHYDPYNDKSYEAAKLIWPHIEALNKELKFSN